MQAAPEPPPGRQEGDLTDVWVLGILIAGTGDVMSLSERK